MNEGLALSQQSIAQDRVQPAADRFPPSMCLFIDDKPDKLLLSGAMNSTLGP